MPGDLLPPLLLTKLVSPLPISWPISLTIKSSSDWPVFPLQPPPYIYIRLRAPRLLRPSCKSPYTCVRLRAPRLLRPSCESPGRPEYICIIKLLYTASLPKLLAQFLATVNVVAGRQSQLLPVCT